MILVVEDNEADTMLLGMALKQAGVTSKMRVISDGAAARKYLDDVVEEQETPELMLLDLNLRKENGVSLLKHLRASGRFRRMPVVVWSSTRSPQDSETVEALGAARFLVKPMTLEGWGELVGELAEVLEEVRAENI